MPTLLLAAYLPKAGTSGPIAHGQVWSLRRRERTCKWAVSEADMLAYA